MLLETLRGVAGMTKPARCLTISMIPRVVCVWWFVPCTLQTKVFSLTCHRLSPGLLRYKVNLRAPFLLMQEAVRVMKREGTGGSIVNIGSMSGYGMGGPLLWQ